MTDKPSSNDQRSTALNPNNSAYRAAQNNISNQLNPSNPAYHSSRAGHANDANIGRVLDPAGACEIRSCVTAPVAEKGHDLWFPLARIRHHSLPVARQPTVSAI